MTKNCSHGKKKTFVCLRCKTIYVSRKHNPKCPNCLRPHHNGHHYAGLIAANRRLVK